YVHEPGTAVGGGENAISIEPLGGVGGPPVGPLLRAIGLEPSVIQRAVVQIAARCALRMFSKDIRWILVVEQAGFLRGDTLCQLACNAAGQLPVGQCIARRLYGGAYAADAPL